MNSHVARQWLAGMACLVAGAAQAASIAWSNGPNYNGANGFQGILTNGSLVAAYDLGTSPSAPPLTVDPSGLNITFTPIDSPFFTAYNFNSGSPGSTDAAWNTIVDTTEWTASNFSAPAFLSGLTAGRSYQVQFFASDSRSCCDTRTSWFSDGVGAPSTPVVQGSFTSVVGTFVADAGSQTINFFANSQAPILSAYVLRDITITPNVPEPSTYAMLLAGLAGLGWVARRRRAR